MAKVVKAMIFEGKMMSDELDSKLRGRGWAWKKRGK